VCSSDLTARAAPPRAIPRGCAVRATARALASRARKPGDIVTRVRAVRAETAPPGERRRPETSGVDRGPVITRRGGARVDTRIQMWRAFYCDIILLRRQTAFEFRNSFSFRV
jgi:hypothetical protein